MKVLLLTKAGPAKELTQPVFDSLNRELSLLLPYIGTDQVAHFATVESHCVDAAICENGPQMKVVCLLHRRTHSNFANGVTSIIGKSLQLLADSEEPCASFLKSLGDVDVSVIQPNSEEWVHFFASLSFNEIPLELPAGKWSTYSLAAQVAATA